MIKATVLIIYLYGLLPLLIGTAVVLLAKHRASLPTVYLSGYTIYLALFEVLVVWDTHRSVSYTPFARHWELTVYILTLFSLICVFLYVIRIQRRQHAALNKRLPFPSKEDAGIFFGLGSYSIIILGLTIALTVLAVLFLTPQAMDETPELARMSLASDTFFSLDPSTGVAYTDSTACPGALHLFYAFGSTMTEVDVTALIHLVMPIFMIPLFVCVHLTIAHAIFPDKARIRDRFRFVWLVMLFYLLMLPLEAHIALVPYRNIWNGITLAASSLLPLFTAICLRLVRHFISEKTVSVTTISNNVTGLLFLTLAIRLCIPFGFVICSLYVVATIVVISVSLMWRRQFGVKTNSDPEGGEPS